MKISSFVLALIACFIIGLSIISGTPAPAMKGKEHMCLFADLGVDPAMTGCQSYEATDFLISNRRIDPSSSLVLWQVGVVGDWTFKKNGYDLSALPLLLERLGEHYDADHNVCVYEASVQLNCEPVIKRLPLSRLAEAGLSAISTLYVPPGRTPIPDPAVFSRLNIPTSANAPRSARS